MKSRIKTEAELQAMRDGGRVLAAILQFAKATAAPGMTTKHLSELMAGETKASGMRASFLDYNGYPDVSCISVNDEVVHGLPGKRVMREGDVVSIDFGITNRGMITDGALTIYLGDQKKMPDDIARLLSGTERSLYAGLDVIKGPTRVGTLAATVQSVLDKESLGIVRDLVGHGVGHGMHEDPNIPNYGIKGSGVTLEPGMTIAVEPMATLGDWRVDILNDGWTVVTRDHSLAAHFEHTVLITDTGVEILTAAP